MITHRLHALLAFLTTTAMYFAPPDAAEGVNSTAPRTDVDVAWPEEDDLGSLQMGGQRTTLLPGTDTFRLPTNLAQLWHDIVAEDTRPFLPNGQPNPNRGQQVKRRQVKFDRNNPLVVVGGAHDGEPMTASFSTNPRPRGKKDEAKTPWISDAAMLLEVGLGDKSRPKTAPELEAAINRFAGKTVRIEHGLTAQCRPDKVRYIVVDTQEPTGQVVNGVPQFTVVSKTMPDPSGAKGCGKRFYTSYFKNPQAGAVAAPGQPPAPAYDLEVECDNVVGGQSCGAVVRAFESVERFLPPLGV